MTVCLSFRQVDFGGEGPITSEQSVAVRGCQSFVVNNYVGVRATSALSRADG
jgi:hypothetical protein